VRLRTIFIVATLFLYSNAPAQSERFELFDIHFSGKVETYQVTDLNGDGLQEIIAFTSQNDATKSHQINIIWQDSSGFSQQNIQTISPDDQMIIFDYGDIVPNKGKELALLTSTGIFYYSLKAANEYDLEPQKLFSATSIFKNVDRTGLFFWKFIRDVNGNGRDEIIIPNFDSVQIYAFDNSNGWSLQSQLQLPSPTKINTSSGIAVTYSLYNLYFADCNQDGLTDIIAGDDDKFQLFYQKPDGKFPAKPDVAFDMEFKTSDRRRGQEFRISDIKDIDGDGVIDLVVNQTTTRESVFNPQSQIRIYLGKPGPQRLWSPTADQTIVASGVQFDEQLIDLDNDGRLDLAVPSVRLGLMRIIKMLLAKSMTMDVNIYRMSEAGKYPAQPDVGKKITVNFSFSLNEDSAGGRGSLPVFDLTGDFNGDGIRDLISAADQRRFQIYYGSPEKLFSNNADFDFEIQLPKNGNQLKLFDLNNNNASDIIISYQKQDDPSGQLENILRILINRIPQSSTE